MYVIWQWLKFHVRSHTWNGTKFRIVRASRRGDLELFSSEGDRLLMLGILRYKLPTVPTDVTFEEYSPRNGISSYPVLSSEMIFNFTSHLQGMCHFSASPDNGLVWRSLKALWADSMVGLWPHLVADDDSSPIYFLLRVSVLCSGQPAWTQQDRTGRSLDMERHPRYHYGSCWSAGYVIIMPLRNSSIIIIIIIFH